MTRALPALLALAAYATVWIALWASLRNRGWLRRGGRSAVMAIGLASHLLALLAAPVDFRFYHALSTVAWVVLLLHWLVTRFRAVEPLGLVLIPSAALAVGLEFAFGGSGATRLSTSWQLNIHASTALAAFALFSIAAAQAIALWLQERSLRAHHFGPIARGLPPLDSGESLLFQTIAVGFALLSVALVSGALFIDDLMAQHLAHKTVLSVLAWIVFAVLLWGRWRHGWRGRRAVTLTLTGMGVLVLAYFGSKLVLELVLQRV